MTSTVCLGLLNDIASRKIGPNPESSSSSLLESMDLVRRPMGLVQLLEELVLVVAGLPVGSWEPLELQVVVGLCPMPEMCSLTFPRFGLRLLPTELRQRPVVAVVVVRMLLAVDIAAWLQPRAAPPSHFECAASLVVPAQECQ